MSRVLVADDEPAVLEVLCEVIEELGHEVIRAHDGREALMLARAQHPSLVVTDHMMPRLSGLELCRELRKDEQLRNVPVILLSAALPREVDEVSAHLAKPFELGEFERVVQRTLARAGGTDAGALPEAPVGAPSAEEAIELLADGLRAPLGGLRELLGEASGLAGPSLELGAVLERALRKVDEVTRTLDRLTLAPDVLAGRGAAEPRRLDLRRYVEGLSRQWRERHPGLPLQLVLPSETALLRVDPERLGRALDELVDNAVRHAHPLESLRLELSYTPHTAVIRLADAGPGLCAAELPGLFERFRRDASGRLAAGSGLPLASELVRSLGGALGVRSAQGQGATFTLTLPRGS